MKKNIPFFFDYKATVFTAKHFVEKFKFHFTFYQNVEIYSEITNSYQFNKKIFVMEVCGEFFKRFDCLLNFESSTERIP